jgi:two-component system nitrate/nitrite response regulator NarL
VIEREEPVRANVRVIVADDHPVYRDGLSRHWQDVDGIDVVGSAADGAAALRLILDVEPDVAVIDLKLPDIDGLKVLEAVQEQQSPTAIVILTAYVDSPTVYKAISLGARGFIEKAASFDEITAAVRSVASGQTAIAPSVSGALAAEIRSRGTDVERPVLTSRETAILKHVADGLSSQQVARTLSISLPTVKTHLTHIYAKLDAPDRSSAVAKAFRLGLLS